MTRLCKLETVSALQARKKYPMMAEFAQRINCGGASAGATSAFMREMMQSSTRISYDNVLALQTFGDDEEDEPVSSALCSFTAAQHTSTEMCTS